MNAFGVILSITAIVPSEPSVYKARTMSPWNGALFGVLFTGHSLGLRGALRMNLKGFGSLSLHLEISLDR